jgi:hypothetical protein
MPLKAGSPNGNKQESDFGFPKDEEIDKWVYELFLLVTANQELSDEYTISIAASLKREWKRQQEREGKKSSGRNSGATSATTAQGKGAQDESHGHGYKVNKDVNKAYEIYTFAFFRLQRYLIDQVKLWHGKQQELDRDTIHIWFVLHIINFALNRNSTYVTVAMLRLLSEYQYEDVEGVLNQLNPNLDGDVDGRRRLQGKFLNILEPPPPQDDPEREEELWSFINVSKSPTSGRRSLERAPATPETAQLVQELLNRTALILPRCCHVEKYDRFSYNLSASLPQYVHSNAVDMVEWVRMHCTSHPTCLGNILEALELKRWAENILVPVIYFPPGEGPSGGGGQMPPSNGDRFGQLTPQRKEDIRRKRMARDSFSNLAVTDLRTVELVYGTAKPVVIPLNRRKQVELNLRPGDGVIEVADHDFVPVPGAMVRPALDIHFIPWDNNSVKRLVRKTRLPGYGTLKFIVIYQFDEDGEPSGATVKVKFIPAWGRKYSKVAAAAAAMLVLVALVYLAPRMPRPAVAMIALALLASAVVVQLKSLKKWAPPGWARPFGATAAACAVLMFVLPYIRQTSAGHPPLANVVSENPHRSLSGETRTLPKATPMPTEQPSSDNKEMLLTKANHPGKSGEEPSIEAAATATASTASTASTGVPEQASARETGDGISRRLSRSRAAERNLSTTVTHRTPEPAPSPREKENAPPPQTVALATVASTLGVEGESVRARSRIWSAPQESAALAASAPSSDSLTTILFPLGTREEGGRFKLRQLPGSGIPLGITDSRSLDIDKYLAQVWGDYWELGHEDSLTDFSRVRLEKSNLDNLHMRLELGAQFPAPPVPRLSACELYVPELMSNTSEALPQGLSIIGKVYDPRGTAVPRVTLSARNLNSGETLTTISSDASGQFSFDGLQAGTYEVTVNKPGFDKLIIDNAMVRKDRLLRLDIHLGVMATSASLASAPPVAAASESAAASVGEPPERAVAEFTSAAAEPRETLAQAQPETGSYIPRRNEGYRQSASRGFAKSRPPRPELLTVRQGQLIYVGIAGELSSGRSRVGDLFDTMVIDPVIADGTKVIPEGSRIVGRVSGVRPASSGVASGALEVEFLELHLPGGAARRIDGILSDARHADVETGRVPLHPEKQQASFVGGTEAAPETTIRPSEGATITPPIVAASGSARPAPPVGREAVVKPRTKFYVAIRQKIILSPSEIKTR